MSAKIIAAAPAHVAQADADDPLGGFRALFSLPEGLIYLDGNSLGALPVETASRLARAVTAEWGQGLIASWNSHDWIGAPRRIGDQIAGLIGAQAGEVVACDSTSVNLFKLLAAGVRHQAGRPVILTEAGDFPTDGYIARGVADLMPGCEVRACAGDEIVAAIDQDTAVVLLTHVHYKTGRRFDMAAVTAAAHAQGALVLWDLSHSTGAVTVDLDGCDADLAVGCGYKYLNGGPGAPAFLFVAERLQAALTSPLPGWMGHAAPFEFAQDYRPGAGIERFLCGTPSILAMTALEQGVELMLRADPAAIAAKAEGLGELFLAETAACCDEYGFEVITPRAFADRGSHISLAHDHAYEICQALIARGVVGDFRTPNVVRFGFAPLYTRYAEVWAAARILEAVMAERAWDREAYHTRAAVT